MKKSARFLLVIALSTCWLFSFIVPVSATSFDYWSSLESSEVFYVCYIDDLYISQSTSTTSTTTYNYMFTKTCVFSSSVPFRVESSIGQDVSGGYVYQWSYTFDETITSQVRYVLTNLANQYTTGSWSIVAGSSLSSLSSIIDADYTLYPILTESSSDWADLAPDESVTSSTLVDMLEVLQEINDVKLRNITNYLSYIYATLDSQLKYQIEWEEYWEDFMDNFSIELEDLQVQIIGELEDLNTSFNQYRAEFAQAIEDLKEILVSGDSNSQDSVSDLEDTTSDFDDAVSDYDSIESDLVDDMDDALSDSSLTDVSGLASYIDAIRLVSELFEYLILESQLRTYIQILCIIGLGLVIIGRGTG